MNIMKRMFLWNTLHNLLFAQQIFCTRAGTRCRPIEEGRKVCDACDGHVRAKCRLIYFDSTMATSSVA